jgi:hypothetical protein
MAPREAVEARPRTTVEILDDAWRLYFADPVLLLAMTALLQLPALVGLILILCEPAPATFGWRAGLAALVAGLLLLPGLASGACQEAYLSWAEGYPVRFGQCLASALRRGLVHVGSQALTLLPAALFFLMCVAAQWSPALSVPLGFVALLGWLFMALFGLSRQPGFAAGQQRFWRGCKFALLATSRHFGRACVLVLLRGILFLFAVLNLHLFWGFGLWTVENLAGVDVALLGVLCSLGNPAYLLAVTAIAWWLLTPLNEALSYLFFVDARTRYEGLDLWQRVDELFPVRQRSKVGAVVLALAAGLLALGPASAEEPLPAVRAARQEMATIRSEVQAAQPYPGGQHWAGRLKAIGERLSKSSPQPGGFRWFQDSTAGFAQRNQTQALALLDNLDTQLALIEESLTRPRREGQPEEPPTDYLKSLVPPDPHGQVKKKKVQPKDEPKKDPIDDDKGGPGAGGGGFAGPGVVGPGVGSVGAAAGPLLVLLIGLGTAVVIAGIGYAVYQWWLNRPQAKPQTQGALGPKAHDFLEDPDKQNVSRLWQEADALARAGDYLGAVRTLYLAVLALLHQARLIRYERTRTNGEYADQLRRRQALHRPFLGLTGVFEVKWYGERTCQAQDYQACRELAEELRVESKPAAG